MADVALEPEGPRTVAHVLLELQRLLEKTAMEDVLSQITCGLRIRSNCQELRRIFTHIDVHSVFDHRPGIALDEWLSRTMSAADPSRVRKLRDLGLELVMCQTRVHLDGDIITRGARPRLEEDKKDVLMGLHSKGVELR